MKRKKVEKTKVISTFSYHVIMKYRNWLRGVKGFTDKTIEVYTKYAFELELLENDWKQVIQKYEKNANSTKRLVLSAIKNWYIFKNDDRATEIKLPKTHFKESDYVTFGEYKDYLKAINKKSKMGFQKYLIIRLLFETGIRASELLWITKKHIHHNRIKILGKGQKERYIRISKWLTSDVEEYLRNFEGEYLFQFGYKNLYQKIKRIDKKRNLTPHMFRRGYAKYCNEKNVSIYDISISMGHSSIETTAQYINKKSEDVKIFNIF